ncbi:RDD family protein [Streptomyces sp. NPDC003688]
MSAPTPAHGDDRPREGYYPDPSIPGYVRYWNGAAWMPGTSRPAPAAGEPLTPPQGARPATPAVVEETGPHFFDDAPPAGSPAWDTEASVADTFLSRRPTPGPGAPPVQREAPPVQQGSGGAQGADGSGFGVQGPVGASPQGGAAQGPVGGGLPGARGAGVPVASGGQFAAQQGNAGAFGAGGPEAGGWAPAGTPGGAGAPGASGPAASGVPGAQGGVAQGQAGANSGPGGQSRPAAAAGGFGAVGAPGVQAPAGTGGPGAAVGGFGVQAPAEAGNLPGAQSPAGTGHAAGARGFDVVTPPGPGGPLGGFGTAVPGARSGQAGGPVAPDLAAQNPGGGQASWAQQVHQLAGGGEEQTVAPWKPVVEDPFLAAARRQAAGRPAGLGKRLVARIIDSLFVGAVTAAAAVPLGVRTVDHLRHKIDAARLSGRTVTVWLIDGTTGTYLAVVLAVLLLFGVVYEVLPTAKWGRTLGKRLCGIQVRDIEAHEPPTFGAALRRWLVYCVPGLLGIGAVGVLWGLFDRPWRQCWHDKAAHTFVAD